MTRKAENEGKSIKYIVVVKLTFIPHSTNMGIYQIPIVYEPLFLAVLRTSQPLALKELTF